MTTTAQAAGYATSAELALQEKAQAAGLATSVEVSLYPKAQAAGFMISIEFLPSATPTTTGAASYSFWW